MVEYIPCYGAPAVHWSLLPATRLASRKILIEQNIKRQTGPALYVISLLDVHSSPENLLKKVLLEILMKLTTIDVLFFRSWQPKAQSLCA
jgi:hypothetical protein